MTDSYSINDSPDGPPTLTLKGDLSSKDREALRGRQFVNLFIRHGDHSQLDYLASSFETIRILDVGSQHFDWTSISNMSSLGRISIGAYWRIPWDLFGNEHVESLSCTWDKRYSVSNLRFPALRNLKVIGWCDESLDPLAQLKGLAYLDLVDSRDLRRLTSVESLSHLSTLRLRGAPKLRLLEGVDDLTQLIALHLEGLKRIERYDVLANLGSLRGLVLRGCAPIASLAVLSKLPELEVLVIGDTRVDDGDLEILQSYPSLKKVMFKNKRGYNWTANEAKKHFNQLSTGGQRFSDKLEDAMKMKL